MVGSCRGVLRRNSSSMGDCRMLPCCPAWRTQWLGDLCARSLQLCYRAQLAVVLAAQHVISVEPGPGLPDMRVSCHLRVCTQATNFEGQGGFSLQNYS